MSTLRYGIIGSGMMGCEHIRNLVALADAGVEVEVAAVADPFARSQRWARHAMGDGRGDVLAVFDDHLTMLDEADLDVVVVATPNHTHRAVLDDLWGRDLHLMVEKPLCTTVADCHDVVAASADHPGVVWMGLEYRYMPPVAAFLEEVRAGSVGALRMVAIREHRFPFLEKVGSWNRLTANTGGTLVEKCCHFFDLMNQAVRIGSPDARPRRVLASGGQDVNHLDEIVDGRPADVLDNAYVIVEYDDGVRACLDLCMFAEASRQEQELVAVGDAGKVEASVPGGEVAVGRRVDRSIRTFDASTDARVGHEGFHHGSSYLEHLGLVEAVRTGAPAAVTVEDGLWSVVVGAAAHRSIDEQRPVVIRPDATLA